MNLNKAFIAGNLTRDPEMRSLPSGQSVASFGVATNRFFTDKQGQKQKQAEFHNVVAFGKLAEIAKQYLAKGALVLIEGRIAYRSWQTQTGEKRYRTEIVAERMQLGPRRSAPSAPAEDYEPEKGHEPEDKEPQAPPPAEEEIQTINYDEENINPDKIPF